MMKRIFLFLLTNILVMVTISLVLNILGIQPYLTQYGLDYGNLMAFCLVWGMGGACISLALSRVMAKWMMGVSLIDPQSRDSNERFLVDTVYHLSRKAGLSVMPDVGVYDQPEINAFATGPTKNRSLVAVSSGLFRAMNRDQVEGVLAHEVAHISNGDMVTMTLIQGVVNAFVMFFARVISFALSQNVKEESRHMVRWITTFILEIVFSILGAMVVAAFSRWREYRADAGGAKYAGKQKMIDALKGLQRTLDYAESVDSSPAIASLKISSKPHAFMVLLMSHPPLEERIKRLEMTPMA